MNGRLGFCVDKNQGIFLVGGYIWILWIIILFLFLEP